MNKEERSQLVFLATVAVFSLVFAGAAIGTFILLLKDFGF